MMVKLLLIPARLRWAHLCDECVDFEFDLYNLRGAGIRIFAVFSISKSLHINPYDVLLC